MTSSEFCGICWFMWIFFSKCAIIIILNTILDKKNKAKQKQTGDIKKIYQDNWQSLWQVKTIYVHLIFDRVFIIINYCLKGSGQQVIDKDHDEWWWFNFFEILPSDSPQSLYVTI